MTRDHAAALRDRTVLLPVFNVETSADTMFGPMPTTDRRPGERLRNLPARTVIAAPQTELQGKPIDAAQDPGYLQATQAAVRDFRVVFREFLALHTPTYDGMGRGLVPAISMLEGTEPEEVTAVAERVAEAAGRARKASILTNTLIFVEGHTKPVDPIATWSSVAQPKPIIEPENVLIACGQIIGALDEMIAAAKVEAPRPAGTAEMHPTVWGAAKPLWVDGHFRAATAAAAEALVDKVKTLVGRRDISDTSIWQHAFSAGDPKPGEIRLRWPGDVKDRDVISMNDGLRQLAPGVQLTIRNGATHSTERMTEQEALERLGTLSLLARWVDECDRVVG